jgi:hypothetical protein
MSSSLLRYNKLVCYKQQLRGNKTKAKNGDLLHA